MSMTDFSQPMVLHLHDFDPCPALLEDVRANLRNINIPFLATSNTQHKKVNKQHF